MAFAALVGAPSIVLAQAGPETQHYPSRPGTGDMGPAHTSGVSGSNAASGGTLATSPGGAGSTTGVAGSGGAGAGAGGTGGASSMNNNSTPFSGVPSGGSGGTQGPGWATTRPSSLVARRRTERCLKVLAPGSSQGAP